VHAPGSTFLVGALMTGLSSIGKLGLDHGQRLGEAVVMKAHKTAGVQQLVSDVLASFRQPVGEDVIEDVCVAIESNPRWRSQYDELARDLRDWVVNNWIGMYVRDLTSMKALRQVPAKRTRLIRSYRKLAR
jgi:hypothetical protein